MKTRFKRFSECGAALVEYSLLLALIYVASIVSLQVLGQRVAKTFDGIQETVAGGNPSGREGPLPPPPGL